MATGDKPHSNTGDKSKKRRQRYLPQNKPVKKKGAYPLKPGVQGFFITCDGGREHQAAHEALNVIDSFFEELMNGKDSEVKPSGLTESASNKKITFSYSDEEDDDDEDHDSDDGDEEETKDEGKKEEGSESNKNGVAEERVASEKSCEEKHAVENVNNENDEDLGKQKNESEEEPPVKKQCLETNTSDDVKPEKTEEKSIDKLIEAELQELGDKTKRRFMKLDPGCNGLVFIQMRRRDGDPKPKEIVQHMMTSAAATRKHMSRFILRVLPMEVSCYASEDEISRAIKPLVEEYFPVETDSPRKFAVLYGARANTGIDRMKIINTVAKSVPAPHKVDLSSPDITVVVEIVKTVCLIGVVEKYKELAKYNLRQLTSTAK
ncbi:PREDICTED: THUMP domain-containing protein 1 homolog [Tarenaya hassleriana]|uniref:THUMP domain-containing protein 1 homolog n=1 Tax=Tarenaya hassleriana TaxID=28532 RepID=UPI00053C14C2|nr:PREDICTED: THUMP domain-containing protein 1 homolog [Tarenaya hassleriana]